MNRRFPILAGALCVTAVLCVTALATRRDLRPPPPDLEPGHHQVVRHQWTDRSGIPLNITYANHWNIQDRVPLHQIPPLLVKAVVVAEDRRFYEHGGVDWRARAGAVFQNVLAGRSVRGASTLSEQVVRMLHPRPRTLWSRWLEGFEAGRLEKKFAKHEILEFYLNQVPYGGQRRGVVQGARFYFNRDPDTLSAREMLTLAVLVRAPGRLHLPGQEKALERSVTRLAGVLAREGHLTETSGLKGPATFSRGGQGDEPVDASHFIRFAQQAFQGNPSDATSATSEQRRGTGQRGGEGSAAGGGKIQTTLDSSLQRRVQHILDNRLKDLEGRSLRNGAVLVTDHATDTVLSWVNGRSAGGDSPGTWIDAVTVPRQPGSTLKPFLYAMALNKGWTPATLIDDSPLAEPVRRGLHPYQNYSRVHYGPVTLRDALGNSLNIPAVKTLEFVGVREFFNVLQKLGFESLKQKPEHYGRGLALGNGEVTLLELVQAYAVLARSGTWRPLRLTDPPVIPAPAAEKVFSPETASLVAHILSDPHARSLEFGAADVFRFSLQTAVKTGTSNDHRDAWALAFNHRYTVGVWMGNLDAVPTHGVSGTTGPGLVLRAVFAELNRHEEGAPLRMSPELARHTVCRATGLLASPHCPPMEEYFLPGTTPTARCTRHGEASPEERGPGDRRDRNGPGIAVATARLLQPSHGLQLARDPHIPDELEYFAFRIPRDKSVTKVRWILNGETVAETHGNTHAHLWPLSPGHHQVKALIWREGSENPEETPLVPFSVH